MSKRSVKCLAVAVAAGLMLGSVLPASAEEAMVRQYETSQLVTSVVADVENTDLVIQKGTGNTIQVASVVDAKGEYTYRFDLEDGVLTIRVEAGEGESITFGELRGKPVNVMNMERIGPNSCGYVWYNEVTVTLPDKLYDRIQTESHNGGVQLTGTETEDLSVEVDNGAIELENTRGKNVTAQVRNGRIVLNQPYALRYDCEVRNGEIQGTLAGTKADYRLEVEVRNGDSNLSDQAGTGAASGSFRVNNGSIHLGFTG